MALRTSLAPQPHLYMGDMQGRPLDAGKVYFGQPNKDPELYPISVYYDEALTIPAPQPIRTMGGFMNANGQMVEIYAAETEYSVKVLDGYGREVFYQPSMSKTNSDGSINVKLPYINTVTRPLSEKNADTVSVKDFGAIGDGVIDDTSALQAAINSGVSLHWGNNNDVYRITAELATTATRDIYWASNGATVKFDPSTSKHSVVYLQLEGFNLTIDNNLNFDAQRKAFTGLRVLNNSETTPSDVIINQVFVTNCHRASRQFSGGDGLYIRGNLDRVTINDPRITNITMAAGAGVSGFNGVSGITVIRNFGTEAKPRSIRILNPHIEEIASEDLSYFDDQDGIKAFTSYERNEALPNDTDVVISGGYFKNCLGRSIKSQCEYTKVKDCHFVRTRGFTRGYGNFEIDFQVGNGSVENITFLYDGSRPNAIVFSNSARGSLVKSITSLASISGVKGVIANQTNGFSAMFTMEAVDLLDAQITVSNIDIQSDAAQGIGYLLAERGSGSKVVIKISNINLRMVSAVVSRLSTNDINVTLDRVTNTRVVDCPPILLSVNTGKLELSCTSCKGLSTVKRISQTEAPTATLVSSIAPANHAGKSGLITPVSIVVPASNTRSLGAYGFSNNAFTAILSIGVNAESQAIIMGGGSLLKMINTSSTIVVSATGAQPGTGTFMFWLDAGQLYFKNAATYEVVLTGLVIG